MTNIAVPTTVPFDRAGSGSSGRGAPAVAGFGDQGPTPFGVWTEGRTSQASGVSTDAVDEGRAGPSGSSGSGVLPPQALPSEQRVPINRGDSLLAAAAAASAQLLAETTSAIAEMLAETQKAAALLLAETQKTAALMLAETTMATAALRLSSEARTTSAGAVAAVAASAAAAAPAPVLPTA